MTEVTLNLPDPLIVRAIACMSSPPTIPIPQPSKFLLLSASTLGRLPMRSHLRLLLPNTCFPQSGRLVPHALTYFLAISSVRLRLDQARYLLHLPLFLAKISALDVCICQRP